MNRKISTYSGIITGILILAYLLILYALHVAPGSPILLSQFLILLGGILVSTYLLYRYYADISFMDTFLHGVRTGITTLVIVLLGNTILFFVLSDEQALSSYTFLLMKTIFAYSFSGLLSAFFTSFIFNTFTKK